jgi:hypothetical protein
MKTIFSFLFDTDEERSIGFTQETFSMLTPVYTFSINFFCNLILFVACTSTFSRLYKKVIHWHVEECLVDPL